MTARAWHVRLYRALLRLYPTGFRRRYGNEMVQFFDDAWSDARGGRRMLLITRAVTGAFVHGLLERSDWDRVQTTGRGIMGEVTQDLRTALRGLARRPGFTLVAVLTVALGIGAASAVFAVADAVVYRQLPYPEADRLVGMWTTFDGQGDFGMSLAEHHDYARESRALEALGSFDRGSSTLTGVGGARRVSVAWTWGDLYDVIGARVASGRLPRPEDTRTGATPVAVASHAFWTSALGADPTAVGRTMELDGVSVEIIGVMDPGVRLPGNVPELWRPIARDRSDIVDRSGHSLEGIGRLAPGVTLAGLRAELDDVHRRWHDVWAGAHSPGHPGHTFAVSGLHDRWFGELRSAGTMMLVSILLVLALACANVASMLLARGEDRAGEIALRRALGASRPRIVRQLLVESVVLAGLGGVVGLAVAALGVDALMRLEPGDLPRVDTIGLDPRVTAFAVGITLLSGLAFGILPALRAGAVELRGRGSTGPGRSAARSLDTLVVGQLALAVVLLAGAGLLVRSVGAIASADTGIRTEDRLTFGVSLAAESYPTMAEIDQYWNGLIEGLETLPGVERAAVVRTLPLSDPLRREGMTVEGRPVGVGDAGAVAYGVVTPGYFSVTGVPVVEGREFERGDVTGARWVGVVNEAAARAYWPGSSPVGRAVEPHFMPAEAGPVTIVGVVGDVQAEGARSPVIPALYLSYAQTPEEVRGYVRHGSVVAVASVDPTSLFAGVESLVQRLDARVPVTNLRSYDDVAAGTRARERFLATVLVVFAALALLIAGMGTYGVVTYGVSRRYREFGVRIALGADRGQVVGVVLRRGFVLAALGLGLGTAGAFAVGPALQGLLFGVGARDALALAAGPLVMGAAVVIASMLPALRASRVDPLEAFREDA